MSQADFLKQITGTQLENIVYRIFTAYWDFDEENVFLVGKSGDYGVDVLATTSDEVTYAVQCKAYAKPVGLAAVQQIVAAKALYHYDVGMVVTTNDMTRNARRLAMANHVKIIDGQQLMSILYRMNGVA